MLFGEGGGGRSGDDNTGPTVAFDTHTFTQFSKLSGRVPLVGVTNGRCFAGNTEAESVVVAKKYLSYFQGSVAEWEAADQPRLRHIVPENRLRLYDMREIIDTIADKNSVLKIREKLWRP